MNSLRTFEGSSIRRRTIGFLALLAVLALFAAACGGSDNGGSAAESTVPSGVPIKVMSEAPVDSPAFSYPEIPGAAKIYEQWINAKGGIAGRPLQVITCEDRGDAAEAANCARKAAEEGVVANVGSFTVDASRAIPILEESQIPWFGVCCTLVIQESTSKISFPMGCLLCFAPAAAIKMIDDGCTNIVQAYGDLPAADLFSVLFANGYKSKGLDPAGLKVVKIPLAPGDYSAQAAQMTEADCLYGSLTYLQWPSLINALNGVGASPRLYGLQGNLNSTIVEQFPKETEGAVVVGNYPNFEGDQWSDYREALETYDAADLEWNSLAGLGTWAAYTAFTQIAESIDGEINNATFLEAANKADAVDTNGMVGDIDFTKEWTGLGGQFPRTFNFTVFFDEVKDGELTPIDGESVDVTNAVEGNPD